MTLAILFQNENFLIVDKPSGALSVPSRFEDKDPRPVLSRLVEKQVGKRIWPVHRLDEEVSGVLIYALNAEAHRIANGWFEERLVQKEYEALTPKVADPQIQTFCWQSRLVKGKKRAYERDFGKSSVTHAQFLKNLAIEAGEYGYWSLKPETGRPHQLRYELFKHGYPIVGDALYGSKEPLKKPNAIALRSVELDFSKCSGRGGLPDRVRGMGIVEWIG